MRTTPTRRMFVLLVVMLVLDRTPIATAQSERPSATALEAAAYRVLGSKHPDPAIRSADVLAEKLLGPAERAILKETGSTVVLDALAMDTELAWTALGTRSVFARGVHVRTRHIDATLTESLRVGATQVVILGAGLDSRAYRFGDALRGVRVFELDLPQTQNYKKARIREVLGNLPAHVTYAPIDFATQDLTTVLRGAGYDPSQRTLFIWEGVTMYVPEPGIDATLRAIATNAARGSRIVFDYFTERALRDRQSVLAPVARNVAAVGEHFVFGMPGDNATAFVTARGFTVVSDFGSAELGEKYLPKAFAMPSPSANRLCLAEIR
jgi:methyltransferase (TIGR00027 family)